MHYHNFLVFNLLSAGPLKPRSWLVDLCLNPAWMSAWCCPEE